MSNQITRWTHKTPKQPGLYLACRGDVETPASMDLLTIIPGGLCFFCNGVLIDLKDAVPGYKFARLAIGSEAKAARIAENAEPAPVMAELGAMADAFSEFVAATGKTINKISSYSLK